MALKLRKFLTLANETSLNYLSTSAALKKGLTMADMDERLILVDSHDNSVGVASKFDCHQWANIQTGGYLHRAFSVFLFNSHNELLLQKRADGKKTFPGLWTNTCCSHPLANDKEMDASEAIGVRRAAERKLQQELGLKVPATELQPIARLIYKAQWDSVWGEHEIDYCLIVKNDSVPIPNPLEASEVQYISKSKLQAMLDESDKKGVTLFTPWFHIIAKHFLFHWWDHLNDLDKIKDMTAIRSF